MLRLRVPHLRPCKKRSIQHRGPQRPHHKQHNDAVTAVLQVVATQKRGDSPLRSSIAHPQGLSMSVCGPLRPIHNVMHFSELAEYSQKCTLGSAPPIRSGQHALVLPISGHRRGTKAPAARSAQRGLPTCPRTFLGKGGVSPRHIAGRCAVLGARWVVSLGKNLCAVVRLLWV